MNLYAAIRKKAINILDIMQSDIYISK